MDNQFYPTPADLAKRAVGLFRNSNITRLLEPSAGRGDLLEPLCGRYQHNQHKIDCIEIDLENQAVLRDKGFSVIDSDFMKFEGRGSFYSHILVNPPFQSGIQHALKAWDLLYEGEMVAILNAATIENASSKEKQFLVDLIDKHGSVEFIDEAFMAPDTKRKTSVRVALVWLEKKSDFKTDFFTDLKVDDTEHDETYVCPNAIALPNSSIENTVRAFKVAVEKMKTACIAEEEANYFARLVGMDLRRTNEGEGKDEAPAPDTRSVTEKINDQYVKLKEAAWRQVLKATDFKTHLSSKAQKRLESDFEQVSKLEFTLSNIYGLLNGIVQQKASIQESMILDVFDLITNEYGTEGNRSYYMGWSSNNKHRKNGFRIKLNRFILPVHNHYGGSLTHESIGKLEDMDKVFALMDGAAKTEKSLVDTYNANTKALCQGQRVSASYFDIRYYPGKGTMHIFPTNKAVVDRLNRTVGRIRQWLPNENTQVDPRFWDQYEKAEKVTAEMQKIIERSSRSRFGLSRLEENELYESAVDVHAEACANLEIELPQLAHDNESVQQELLLTDAA
jgi:hypothetical protein